MPGHTSSPYWAAVDFDSEDEDDPSAPSPNQRQYLDPWDNQANGLIQAEIADSSQGDNLNNSLGEPVSGSFYYVPTKNYESDEETQISPPKLSTSPHLNVAAIEYPVYERKLSRTIMPNYHHPDMAIYGDRLTRNRRVSMYKEQVYEPHPLIYEPIYGPIVPPPPGYMAPHPQTRIPLQHPEYVTAAIANGKPRRHSRMTDAYDHYAYESLSPEYEDWARPYPKTVPDNFHLSRYGHLEIDYSCSWNSLDRLIRNK